MLISHCLPKNISKKGNFPVTCTRRLPNFGLGRIPGAYWMTPARSKTPLSTSRSPIPPSNFPNSPSPRPFLPPSHYAAAAGIAYTSGLKSSQGSKRPEKETDPPSFAYSSQGDSSFSSPRRDSCVPISYPSQPFSDSSEFDPAAGMRVGTNKEKRQCGSGSGSRARRQSNLGDLPFLEANLLPSLRDTIDRMTRSPARPRTAAASSPPSSDPLTCESSFHSSSFSTAAFEAASPIPLPSMRAPSTPRASTPQASANLFSPTSAPVETSTPKQTAKFALKSALKSPAPKLQVQRMDVATTMQPSSPAISLRSVKSIIGVPKRTPISSQTNSATPKGLAPPQVQNEGSTSPLGTLQSRVRHQVL
jgi:hypothetical protein